jgi:hypothetical protein
MEGHEKENDGGKGYYSTRRCTGSTFADRTFFMAKLKAYRWALKVNYVAGAQFMKPVVSLLQVDIKVLATPKPHACNRAKRLEKQ